MLDDVEGQVNLYRNAKLSTIWKRAAKDKIIQTRGVFGIITNQRVEACAMGAICYYLSDRESVTPYMLPIKEGHRYERLLQAFKKRTGMDAAMMNDVERRTFTELAQIAKKVGL